MYEVISSSPVSWAELKARSVHQAAAERCPLSRCSHPANSA
jgi:hypothetical protein